MTIKRLNQGEKNLIDHRKKNFMVNNVNDCVDRGVESNISPILVFFIIYNNIIIITYNTCTVQPYQENTHTRTHTRLTWKV